MISAPIESINIPEWVFSLSGADYQECSRAHLSAANTAGPEGRRMSINVKVTGAAWWFSTTASIERFARRGAIK